MFKTGLAVTVFAATAPSAACAEALAEDAPAESTGVSPEQLQKLQTQIESLQKQIDALKSEAAKPTPQWKGAPQWTASEGWGFKPRGRLQVDAGYVRVPGAYGAGQHRDRALCLQRWLGGDADGRSAPFWRAF